ncbi:MAG: hypothetical protein ACI8WY_003427 [Planctomycetota bacterium]|jgi:hypothetical protein
MRLSTTLIPALVLLLSNAALGQSLETPVNHALGLTSSDVQNLTIDGTLQSGVNVAVRIDGGWSMLSLSSHSVRAEGFQVIEHRADGTYVPVDPGPVVTVRGTLEGETGSIVSGALLDDGLYVRIERADGTELWLQPVPQTIIGAKPNSHVLYARDAVIATGRTCGTSLLANQFGDAEPFRGSTGSTDGGLYTAELACDADYEYFLDYGSTTAVSNRIQTVIGSINQQYESEVGITHAITQILVRTSSNQPYTSADAGTLLNQFRSQWNSNHGSIPRDVAQLFSGKSIIGGTIGIAWVGVICNSSYAYGMVESDFNGNFSSATDLSAHELGHNWNASHCSCTSYTMNPYITSANTFNPNVTRNTITSFRDSRSCLDLGAGGNPPGPTSAPSPSNGASGAGLNVDLSWTAGSGATTHDVYFGTDATPDAGEFQVNTGGTSFDPGTLQYSTTYYWRTDAVNVDGTTSGSVWSFTTQNDPNGSGETVIFSDSFDGAISSSWSSSGRLRSSGSAAFAGSGGARLKGSQAMSVTVSTAGYTGLRLECARRTQGLDGSEDLVILVNGTQVDRLTGTTSWQTNDIDLSAFAGGNVTITFDLSANKNNERADIDEVRVVGIQ